jgi:hypothetical protein
MANTLSEDKIRDLVEKLRPKPLNGICEFVLKNGTPPEWGVVITQGGAKFFYSDGTDYTDGPKSLNLRSGDSYSFYSDDASKCVKQVFLAINVYVPGEGEQTEQGSTEMAEEGKCWTRLGLELGKRDIISEDEIGHGTIGQTLILEDLF